MDIEDDIFARLAAPFPVESVHWRVGSKTNDKKRGMCLAYIDARDVMDRLDAVVGPENWQTDFVNSGNGATCCRVAIRIDGEWLWKADGAGQTSYEGDKGQFSDALKRAAVSWGIARYLYSIPSPWVELTDKGNISDKGMEHLRATLEKATSAVEWGSRKEQNLFRMLRETLRTFCTNQDMLNDFLAANKGTLQQLPGKMKEELRAEISRMRIGFSTTKEVA